MKDRPLSVHEYKLLQAKTARRKKYGNYTTEIDGIKFDSLKEAEYYGKCKLRVKAGEIKTFSVHQRIPIIINDILICNYEADFILLHPDDSISVIDVKSEATEGLPVFVLKKKLMKAIYNIEIKIIK